MILIVVLLGGCTRPEGPSPLGEPTTSPSPVHTPSQTRDVATSPPAPLVKSAVSVRVQIFDRWVKPPEPILANASVPEGANVAWFLAPRNPIVPGADRIDYVPPTLNLVGEGSSSSEARMAGFGRYAYAARDLPLVRFNVTVSSSLPVGGAQEVLFVQDAWGARFAPSELLVGRDTGVYVRNAAPRDVDVVRVDQMLRVAPDGRSASIAPPTLLGDYDVIALARDDADGWGEASVRVIVDARKPDAAVSLGPWNGTFVTSFAQAEGPQDRSFEARFNASNFTLRWTSSTDAPAGAASVRVSLLDGEGKVVEKADGASGVIGPRGLPRGAYVVRVEPLEGVRVAYTVEGALTLVLEPPPSFFRT